MSELVLSEEKHPQDSVGRRYDELCGIDALKEQLLDHLALHLDSERLRRWACKHHGKGLRLVERLADRLPAVLLSGEVGCGKTALATSVGTPLARLLNSTVLCFETPSDIRGSGRVGEISARITAAFQQARGKLTRGSYGLLIIDEADDLATSRAQLQAHHEDRAGLNVLVKQLDLLERERVRLGILLITNRPQALDPAVVRRMTLHLTFSRPDDTARRRLFAQLLGGLHPSAADLDALVAASAPRPVPFSYSDLTGQLPIGALHMARRDDRPLSIAYLLDALRTLTPAPLMAEQRRPLHNDGGPHGL